MPLESNTAYRLAAGLALTAAFLIVWLNAAAGLIGIEDDDPANLMYVGVLAIGLIGAVTARFQPRGLARALFATALAQALVGAIALKLPNTASSVQILLLHGLFVALFAGAALLFRYAAREGFPARAGDAG
jgi:GNAT superfamily N-acetyltransferase